MAGFRFTIRSTPITTHATRAREAIRTNPVSLLDFRNNIVYDWGDISGYSGLERTRLNYVGNYFKPGASTSEGVRDYAFSARTFRTKLYLADNFMVGAPEKTAAELAHGAQMG